MCGSLLDKGKAVEHCAEGALPMLSLEINRIVDSQY